MSGAYTVAQDRSPVGLYDTTLRDGAQREGLILSLADKLSIIDGGAATAARTRVTIDSTDGVREWSTMGSGTNIIAASAAALIDSLEYAIWKSGAEVRRRDERSVDMEEVRAR
jgi:2-isopropylmalate synthase